MIVVNSIAPETEAPPMDETADHPSLLALLATLEPIQEDFPPIDDPLPEPWPVEDGIGLD